MAFNVLNYIQSYVKTRDEPILIPVSGIVPIPEVMRDVNAEEERPTSSTESSKLARKVVLLASTKPDSSASVP